MGLCPAWPITLCREGLFHSGVAIDPPKGAHQHFGVLNILYRYGIFFYKLRKCIHVQQEDHNAGTGNVLSSVRAGGSCESKGNSQKAYWIKLNDPICDLHVSKVINGATGLNALLDNHDSSSIGTCHVCQINTSQKMYHTDVKQFHQMSTNSEMWNVHHIYFISPAESKISPHFIIIYDQPFSS